MQHAVLPYFSLQSAGSWVKTLPYSNPPTCPYGFGGEQFTDRVHINSSEGFRSKVKRTVSGVFHHISTTHANLDMHEIGFRWSQCVVKGQAVRQTRNDKKKLRTIWSRVPPALQIAKLLRNAVGHQMRWTQ
ncbi:ISXO2-like transposase domain-containing protein [Pseudovibrio ascidiaceicola]|uniref:ISXO2-like transposase domain-containing protein n=1 Tax=Pseudovibrio ascidiaceicola TaxID=285279 RepID=A0A1I4FQ74_9HYPH|nr:transposase [Pseudovibrio ascidiaceicola]SFL18946.1 ISXO2-like transposase domain-containing protein [Pseudovibrio ascidiaceicola]